MAESSLESVGFGMKGWLLKWTNYIKGYQPRWFVLSNGTLSYYRNQAEMAHTCRGTINLEGALIHTHDPNTFVISSGASQAFYLKATGEVERQRWVTALELAKTKAISMSELLDETGILSEQNEQGEVLNVLRILGTRIENLQSCYNLLVKYGNEIKRALSAVQTSETDEEITNEIKNLNQVATLFRITSKAMITNCIEYLELVKIKFHILHHILGDEQIKRKHLEDIVDQLAARHAILQKATKERLMLSDIEIEKISKPVRKTDVAFDDEGVQFFDALENSSGLMEMKRTASAIFKTLENSSGPMERKRTSSAVFKTSDKETIISTEFLDEPHQSTDLDHNLLMPIPQDFNYPSTSQLNSLSKSAIIKTNIKRKSIERRTRIPNRPNVPINLWSVMKNCTGKDLSKIPLPVNFSEPLSMLQRLAEDLVYSSLLDHAASCEDPSEQLAYLAAFVISSYASTACRSGKPFNPLLGETYELDRTDDYGWRLISEQVSHHPPMLAQHCESKDWTFWQEFTMSSKFKGRYLQVDPSGIAHLLVHNSGYHYTWRKVTTTVHNIIVGTLWVDQHGQIDIINHTNGYRCQVSFLPFSYFKTENQRRVKGVVYDQEHKGKWIIDGTWDKEIKIAPVLKEHSTKDVPIYDTGNYIKAWECINPSPESEKYYNMSVFACQLNQMEEGVAPTDSRFRPDQRLMEEGEWDEANIIKIALEEKQRANRKAREKPDKVTDAASSKKQNKDSNSVDSADAIELESDTFTPYEPTWFKKEIDPITSNIIHIYDGSYWAAKEKQDWSRCPNIFI